MNTTIYLCDKIERVNFSAVKDITDQVVTFYPGFSFSEIENIMPATFTQDAKNTPAGLLIDEKLAVNGNINPLTNTDLTRQPQIFRLRTSDGQIAIWGSLDNPVVYSANSRKISETKYTFLRQSTDFLF